MKKLFFVFLLAFNLWAVECEDYYSGYLKHGEAFQEVFDGGDFAAMKVENGWQILLLKEYLLCVEDVEVKNNALSIYGNLLKVEKIIDAELAKK